MRRKEVRALLGNNEYFQKIEKAYFVMQKLPQDKGERLVIMILNNDVIRLGSKQISFNAFPTNCLITTLNTLVI
jgi:hypothetical protein